MNLDELLTFTTPGPFVVKHGCLTANNDDGCVVAVRHNTIYDERVCPAEAAANLALIAHSLNHFPKLVDLLHRVTRKFYVEVGDSLTDAQMLELGICDIMNEVDEAIKDAEEVKV